MISRNVQRWLFWLSILALTSVAEPDTARPPVTSAFNHNTHKGAVTAEHASSAVTTSSNSLLRNSVCASRTINYITHTLPQQCLRTDRSHSHTSVASSDTTFSGVSTSATSVSFSDEPSSSSAAATLPSVSSSLVESRFVPSAASTSSNTETEPDSPLDNANFLSFEDWKKQNLAKAGQSPENVGSRNQQIDPARRQPGINALDTLGDESEIDLDFSGFGSPPNKPSDRSSAELQPSQGSKENLDINQASPAAQALRPRDAGKTCKERTNYASFDCAATVLKSNSECKSASSVLVENKDSYMLNKCSAGNKFFIVELCNDILIDTVVLANYEFFSSIFRHFRVSVSDRYPVKLDKWKDLGTFEARNTRDVQAFLIENPLIWARYLRIEFLTHYGSEYYCPISLLRVHGTTMMEEFRHQEEIARGEVQEDELVIQVEKQPASLSLSNDNSVSSGNPKSSNGVTQQEPEIVNVTVSEPNETSRDDKAIGVNQRDSEISHHVMDLITTSQVVHESPISNATCDVNQADGLSEAGNPTSSSTVGSSSTGSTSRTNIQAMDSIASNLTDPSSSTTGTSSSASSFLDTTSTTVVSHDVRSSIPDATSTVDASSTPAVTQSTASSQSSPNNTRQESTIASPTVNSTRSSASVTISQQAQPTTQESFYKSIHKRLQQLESNSTLSLQYIEEQSRILRDAFNKVEKRQIGATTSFLSQLNDTVMIELRGFRQAYDQLWQSTVIELEGQREQHQVEMAALSSRLTLVANELVWQKRMGIAQSTLLLLCLGLVLFARPSNGSLEVPLVQSWMNRSHAAFRSGYDSDYHSPSSGRSPVSMFRQKLMRTNTAPTSGNVTDEPDSRPLSSAGSPRTQSRSPSPSRLHTTHEPDEDDEEDEEEEEDDSDGYSPTTGQNNLASGSAIQESIAPEPPDVARDATRPSSSPGS